MQKLLTVYLDTSAYAQGKFLVGSFAAKHGLVEEHLRSYLDQGWTVKSVHGFGGRAEGINASGWMIVVLESVE